MAIKAKVDEFLSDMKSITSIPMFTLSPARKINKEEGEGKGKDEKMKTRFLEAWNNLRYDLGSGSQLKKDEPILILGVFHHSRGGSVDSPSEDEEEEIPVFDSSLARRVFTDFSSRPWFTYRKNFPPLSGTEITSDTGWGCMLRTAQMMVAQGLILHFLGRNWRWCKKQTNHEKHVHRKILGWFIDDPGDHCPLSIHHLSEIGRRYGSIPGNWYGPSTVAYIMQQAVKDGEEKVPEMKEVVVYVAQDGTIYSEDVYDLCEWRKDEGEVRAELQQPRRLSESSCTSSASSEVYIDEIGAEASETSAFFVPRLSTEESIRTSKIINNMMPMVEFTNSNQFYPDVEVEEMYPDDGMANNLPNGIASCGKPRIQPKPVKVTSKAVCSSRTTKAACKKPRAGALDDRVTDRSRPSKLPQVESCRDDSLETVVYSDNNQPVVNSDNISPERSRPKVRLYDHSDEDNRQTNSPKNELYDEPESPNISTRGKSISEAPTSKIPTIASGEAAHLSIRKQTDSRPALCDPIPPSNVTTTKATTDEAISPEPNDNERRDITDQPSGVGLGCKGNAVQRFSVGSPSNFQGKAESQVRPSDTELPLHPGETIQSFINTRESPIILMTSNSETALEPVNSDISLSDHCKKCAIKPMEEASHQVSQVEGDDSSPCGGKLLKEDGNMVHGAASTLECTLSPSSECKTENHESGPPASSTRNCEQVKDPTSAASFRDFSQSCERSLEPSINASDSSDNTSECKRTGNGDRDEHPCISYRSFERPRKKLIPGDEIHGYTPTTSCPQDPTLPDWPPSLNKAMFSVNNSDDSQDFYTVDAAPPPEFLSAYIERVSLSDETGSQNSTRSSRSHSKTSFNSHHLPKSTNEVGASMTPPFSHQAERSGSPTGVQRSEGVGRKETSKLRRRSSTLDEHLALGYHEDIFKISHNRTSSKPSVSPQSSQSKAALILVPVRLGESSLNPIYAPCVKAVLSLESSIGIMGGKPKHSLFFVGFQGDNLLHLDPHYCQQADTPNGFRKNLHDYHTMSVRKINVRKIDPSCCLGFYCRNAEEFETFKKEGQKLFSPPQQPIRYPMCNIEDGRSGDHHPPTELLSPSDPNEHLGELSMEFSSSFECVSDNQSHIPQVRTKSPKKSASEYFNVDDMTSRLHKLNLFPKLMRQKSSSPSFKRKKQKRPHEERSLESEFELL